MQKSTITASGIFPYRVPEFYLTQIGPNDIPDLTCVPTRFLLSWEKLNFFLLRLESKSLDKLNLIIEILVFFDFNFTLIIMKQVFLVRFKF